MPKTLQGTVARGCKISDVSGPVPGASGPATEVDIAEIAQLLGDAFIDDPELRAFVDGRARRRRLRSYLDAEARLNLEKGGVVDVCRSADGEALGAAVWEAPGARETPWQTLRYAPAMLEGVRVRGLLNWLIYRSEFIRFRPAAPHWHLVRLATDVRFRGRGIGTALLEKRLEMVGSTGTVAHLEASSPASARLYERLGFEVVGEIRLPFDTRIFAMTRIR